MALIRFRQSDACGNGTTCGQCLDGSSERKESVCKNTDVFHADRDYFRIGESDHSKLRAKKLAFIQCRNLFIYHRMDIDHKIDIPTLVLEKIDG